MSSFKLELPEHFPFKEAIAIRITDVNYGNHVGNDAVLSLIHEARMRYLRSLGFTELNFAGTGLIMRNVFIDFKAELFYGDTLEISVAPTSFTKVGFTLVYLLEKVTPEKRITAAKAQTTMICFDYATKKMMPVPAEAIQKMNA